MTKYALTQIAGDFHVVDLPALIRAHVDKRVKEETAALRAQRDELHAALRSMLLSQDASWEENNLGHDWQEACHDARLAIAKVKEVRSDDDQGEEP